MSYFKEALCTTDTEPNLFKQSFKYYKSRNPPPCLASVLDVRNSDHAAHFIVVPISAPELAAAHCSTDLKPRDQWRLFTLPGKPGLLILDNFLTTSGSLRWTKRFLFDYPLDRGNVTNFCGLGQRDSFVGDDFVERLRWITLGYHYDWTAKEYTETRRHVFPSELAALCAAVAGGVSLHPFHAQAAIVNYYALDSTLSGHVDRSEQDLHQPLFSFSFGQSGVFLLGGRSIAERPVALLLHHGQCVVMSGAQRLAYHGVPRIVPGVDFAQRFLSDTDAARDVSVERDTLLKAARYLDRHRVNVSVRQVNLNAAVV